MTKEYDLTINKISNIEIVNAVEDFSSVSIQTIRMIVSCCKTNPIYSDIFVKLADQIRLGLETHTIRRIAENIKEDIELSLNKASNGLEKFDKRNAIAA